MRQCVFKCLFSIKYILKLFINVMSTYKFMYVHNIYSLIIILRFDFYLEKNSAIKSKY